MIKNIHHVGIVVNNLDEALASFRRVFGDKAFLVKELPDKRGRVATLKIGYGGSLELMEPTPQDTKVYQFRESNGEGVHHICFEVDDIYKELNNLKIRGVKILNEEPQPGLEGSIGLIHPKTTNHVMIELIQPYSIEQCSTLPR